MIALDTNVFAYAAFRDDGPRKRIAVDLLTRAALVEVVVPIQAFIEFGNASLKRRQLSAAAAMARIEEWAKTFPTAPTRPDHVLSALALVRSHQLAYFDAVMVAVAAANGATTLVTEDMHDGGLYEGVRILDPFNPANAATVEALFAG